MIFIDDLEHSFTYKIYVARANKKSRAAVCSVAHTSIRPRTGSQTTWGTEGVVISGAQNRQIGTCRAGDAIPCIETMQHRLNTRSF